MKTNEINIRDPFVLVHEGRYYLYGTRGGTCWGMANGFDVYIGDDLENWSEPLPCFENDGTFWADRNYWAPEVHKWHGKFYMFASFKSETRCRGTQILVSDQPEGPFRPISDGPVTPENWECLDGTFYVSKAGDAYIVFCHEWVQVSNGEICAMKLTPDLREPVGEPRVLFRAGDVSWVRPVNHSTGIQGYVTDGPFLWKTAQGSLLILWASFSDKGYTEGIAVSDNGDIDGTFTNAAPLFREDGGHGMVFRALDGNLWLTLHSPNESLKERPKFYPLREKDGLLVRL